jgi:hypothetical protein
LAELLERGRPDVVYTPSIVPAGLVVAAARSLADGPNPAWLTGIGAFDLMTDYQRPTLAQQVTEALNSVDGILPFSTRSAGLLAAATVRARVFPVATTAADLDLEQVPVNRSPPSDLRTIAVDGRHDLLERGLVALAALQAIADELRGYDVVVLNAPNDVALAAELLAADAGLRVESVPPEATSPSTVLRAHARARVSIHVSLAADVCWWEISALAQGVVPIVSAESDLSIDWATEALIEPVDPEDPRAIGSVVSRMVADDALVERAQSANSDFARRRFATSTAAAQLAAAIATLAGDR